MGREKDFVNQLVNSAKKHWDRPVILRASEAHRLGVPDLIIWAAGECFALEAKQVHPMLEDPRDPGRRTGDLLRHPFSGPQIIMLRDLKRVGVHAWGIVRVSEYCAFRIQPEAIPTKTGNLSHGDLADAGYLVDGELGTWRFW